MSSSPCDQMLISERIRESIAVKEQILRDEELIRNIVKISNVIRESFQKGGKLLLCGNGGSATDAMHIAGEFVGRFQCERQSLPAIALNENIAALTAIANDYSYNDVFSRAVEGLMRPEDVLIGISTSGNSENVYRAMIKAKEMGGVTAALLGGGGGKIKEQANYSIVVPDNCTARVQESHIMIGHIICEMVESSRSNKYHSYEF